jgi:tripartite-type tricarboxylate transporter receptor subunit TctC
MKPIVKLLFAAAFAALVPVAAFAQAQSYPSRPIKVIVPFAPGGGVDAIARIVGQEMSKGLGQPIVVEHRTGAAGIIGITAAAKADPDGYTLVVLPGGHPLYSATYKMLPFDVVKSFDFVSKAKPDGLTFGNSGAGSTHQFTIALIADRTGTKFISVPFQGEVAATTALLGGQIDFLLVTPTQILSHIESGKVRPLAVTGNTRFSKLPNVPTVEEAIGLKGFDIRTWFGLAGPAGIPNDVILRLNAEMQKALANPEVRQRLEAIGGEISPSTSQEFRDRVAREATMWNEIAKASNFQKL